MSLFDGIPAVVRGIEPPKTEPEPRMSREEVADAVSKVMAEIQRREWLADPDKWCRERMGITLWSGQRKIMESVRDHRRTAAQSCHEIGKSFSAALVCCWWLDCHAPGSAFVVTTAPTNPQVRAILWREIGKMHAGAGLRGRVNQTEWFLVNRAGNEELVAFGRKPDDYSPTAFQGIHAPFVLVVVDESCGVRGGLWDAADSLIANDDSKLLEIGNPDDPRAEFHQHCQPGSGYNVVQVGAFDTPNFTGEEMPKGVLSQLIGKTWVEEKRRRWAPSWYWVDKKGKRVDFEWPGTVPDKAVRVVPPKNPLTNEPMEAHEVANPLWLSKVLGLFPRHGDSGTLIPMEWIIAAQNRSLDPLGAGKIGVDVGGGGDASVGAKAQGPVVRVLWEDHNPDTMHTCGVAVAMGLEHGVERVQVDSVGIGRGVVDRAKEVIRERKARFEQEPPPFEAVNVGEKADDDKRFFNRRSELHWLMRERFERGEADIDPTDLDLAGELADVRYSRLSDGRIKVESKDEIKKRTKGKSPNRMEAVMLAWAPAREDRALEGKLTWGRR